MRILEAATERPTIERLLRSRVEDDPTIRAAVEEILQRIRQEGDAALLEFTRRFDSPVVDTLGLRVGTKEVKKAYGQVDKAFLSALRTAKKRLEAFHQKQKPRSWTVSVDGVKLEQRFGPVDRAGIYVPGGKAAYLSTVMMNAIPARIAGVHEVAMATPAGKDGSIHPEVLVAANECGVTEIWRMGGAQAIGAFAYGTESIKRVDTITGPGNAYVAAAKKRVFGEVGIDMVAGPTEVLVVADDSAPAAFVAADIIAQAEHDEMARPVVITTSKVLADAVVVEVRRQLESAPRRAIARAAVEANGIIVLVRSLLEALDFVNLMAPEHLEVMLKSASGFVKKVRHAGSIFVGPWSMEALGDYAAGPNHTLPTSGTARFSSPLGVMAFMKFTNVVHFNRKQSVRLSPIVEVLATAEGFHGHAASAAIRRNSR
jgi:histidinol dehydrogenase